MKGICILFLMILILLQSFSKLVIIAEYQINREYIASKLCINRNIPKMHCNGKCQMMKKLSEEEKNNAPVPAAKTQEPCIVQNIDVPCLAAFIPDAVENTSHYQKSCSFMPPSSVFHPPAMV